MKTLIFFLLCIVISVIANGQVNKNKYTDENWVSVSPPSFMGDESYIPDTKDTKSVALNNYLIKNLQYPEKSKSWVEEGTEVVQFTVSTTGKLTDFHVINSVSPEIDHEVIRVLQTTDNMWKPGMNNGNPVAMEKEISMAFSMIEGGVNSKEFADHAKRYFIKGSKKMLVKGDSKSALKFLNTAVCYMPYDKSCLMVRGMCKYSLGDKNGACQDWNRVNSLGGPLGDSYLKDFCQVDGYAEMVKTLKEK